MANLKSTTINDTGFLQLPSGTTGERPSSPTAGEIRFNTDTKVTEWYDDQLDSWFPTGVVPPVATGGDTVEDVDIDGVTYRIHSFTSVGESDFTVTRGGSVDYLIVAGGGSGGSNRGGGAGGGGLLAGSTKIINKVYTVNVGDGGDPVEAQEGNNGQNSSAFNYTAIGGGGGGSQVGEGGQVGGAGGGGAGIGSSQYAGSEIPGIGTPGQGNAGGAGTESAGGGGGAGSPGINAPDVTNNTSGGSGGAGLYLGTTYTDSYGENGWFSGGGAGQGNLTGGGLGGGGNGADDENDVTNAQPNTGGGGGGGRGAYVNSRGGSGIVIIRYRIS